jgi:hypothetical protein
MVACKTNPTRNSEDKLECTRCPTVIYLPPEPGSCGRDRGERGALPSRSSNGGSSSRGTL